MSCPVRGQIYYPECAPCDGTCRNPNPPCPLICKPGCACPEGYVIFDRKACVNKSECPQGDTKLMLYNIFYEWNCEATMKILNC